MSDPAARRAADANPASAPAAGPAGAGAGSAGRKSTRTPVAVLAALGCLLGGFFMYRAMSPADVPVQRAPSFSAPEPEAPAPDPHAGQHYDPVTQRWSDNRTDDGLYPQTRERKLVAADVAGLTASELRIMRNEIFARHGYAFQTADMREYFGRQPWYTARSREVSLSAVEQYNVQFIRRHE